MKKIFFAIFGASLFLMQGCNKFVEGYDVSPNNPVDVPLNLLLTQVEVATFQYHTGQPARTAGIFVQHFSGTLFQMAEVYEDYNVQEGDVDNEWQGIYETCLMDAQVMIDKAAKEGAPHYGGIGKVLKALNLALVSDFWGDVPNSEALKGLQDVTPPKYDSQESVYKNIQDLLTSAIADFNAPGGIKVPGADDLIHGGDISKWEKAAWILKARYANRLSKRPGSYKSSDAEILSYIANAGLTGPADDAYTKHGLNTQEFNQWYSFENNRKDYLKISKTLFDFLDANKDPRKPIYLAPNANNTFSGAPQSSYETQHSYVGSYFASPNSPLPLITYVEAKFIEAETAHRIGAIAQRDSAYNDALEKGLNVFVNKGVMSAADKNTYFTANNATSPKYTNNPLQKIMYEKYIALFTQVEPYNDWRRTGIPVLTPNPNGKTAQIPLRLPTPLSERTTNPKAPIVSDITLPVWWDN